MNIFKKSIYSQRKDIYKALWKREWSEDHLTKIDALARELGIAIPDSLLVNFGEKEQEKVLGLLLEAERNRHLSKSWVLSIFALIFSIFSVIASWWAALT